MNDDDFDPSGLTALVVDDNHYERSISLDQLRAMGFGRAMGAASPAEAWELLLRINPDLVLTEWIDSVNSGLDFVRKVRLSPDAPNRAAAIFVLTTRGSLTDVEIARKAGADGFLRKPVSALALKQRVRTVVTNPQPFIVSEGYVGPCRRRRQDPDYAGPRRRANDAAAAHVAGDSAEGVNMLARKAVAELEANVREYRPNEASAVRALTAAIDQLTDAADALGDPHLAAGARELARYVRVAPTFGRIDAEVLHTHVAALHQIAQLPTSLSTERQHMARGIKRMIDKKLRKSASAA